MSEHFSRSELIRSKVAQDLGLDNTPPAYALRDLDMLAAGLERIRAFLGHPMTITSGYRCLTLNLRVGGSPKSQHMAGQAADFVCPAYGDPQKVVEALSPMKFILGIDQLIDERGWVHVSFTLTPRYQVLRDVGGGRTELV